jgi:hypothetical protein
VGQECARKAETGVQNAERSTEGLQTQGILRPTWDTHRRASVVAPRRHRGGRRRTGPGCRKSEIRSPKPEASSNTQGPKAPSSRGARISVISCPALRISFGFRASDFGLGRSAHSPAVRMPPGGLGPHGCARGSKACAVQAKWRRQRAVARWMRGPPEASLSDRSAQPGHGLGMTTFLSQAGVLAAVGAGAAGSASAGLVSRPGLGTG